MSHSFNSIEREARVGIEPTHTAFAEPRLTTWLPRLLTANDYASPLRGGTPSKSSRAPGASGEQKAGDFAVRGEGEARDEFVAAVAEADFPEVRQESALLEFG